MHDSNGKKVSVGDTLIGRFGGIKCRILDEENGLIKCEFIEFDYSIVQCVTRNDNFEMTTAELAYSMWVKWQPSRAEIRAVNKLRKELK